MAHLMQKRYNDNFRGLLKRSESGKQLLLIRKPIKPDPKITESVTQKDKRNPSRVLTVESKNHISTINTGQIVGRRSSSRALVRVKSLKQSDMVICPFKAIPKSKTTKFSEKTKFSKEIWDDIDLSDIEQNIPNNFEDNQKRNDESFISIITALDNV